MLRATRLVTASGWDGEGMGSVNNTWYAGVLCYSSSCSCSCCRSSSQLATKRSTGQMPKYQLPRQLGDGRVATSSDCPVALSRPRDCTTKPRRSHSRSASSLRGLLERLPPHRRQDAAVLHGPGALLDRYLRRDLLRLPCPHPLFRGVFK